MEGTLLLSALALLTEAEGSLLMSQAPPLLGLALLDDPPGPRPGAPPTLMPDTSPHSPSAPPADPSGGCSASMSSFGSLPATGAAHVSCMLYSE
jgi:hypothetical protein